jgi:putative membrane protein
MSATPLLEGRLHPLAVLVIARRFVGAGALPVLVLAISAGTRVIVPLVLGLLVAIGVAVLAWWRFRYRVAAGRLELHSGVVGRHVRTIPLDRVRGVVVTEPFVHRLLGLVKVEVEAAAGGESDAELSLAAVSRTEAERLREVLLGRRAAAERVGEPATLYRATPGLLAVGGVTSLSYLLAPTAVIGVVLNLADDIPGGLVERGAETALDHVPTHPLGITLTILAAVALVFAIAAFGSLLVDWRFTLLDDGERVTAARGLLTRRVVVLDRDRVRGTDVRDTPLRRPLGLASVTAIAAGLRGRTGGTTLAPVLPAAAAAALIRSVDRLAPDPAEPLAPHPPRARVRRFERALVLPLVVLAVAAALVEWWAIALALVLSALAVFLALDRFRQLGHAFDGRRLTLREGSLRRRWSEVDPAGVVAYDVRSSPGQRRAGLCTVTVHLGQGAGSRRALDAGEGQAATLLAALEPRLLAPLVESGPRDE